MAPGSTPNHIFSLTLFLRCTFRLQISLCNQSWRDWQLLYSVGCKLFVFVQVLVKFLHWIDTLVLKTKGNTYRRCATSPFPLRGNTNARLQGHGGILCIFAKEVPKGVAVAEGFLVPLLRSTKTRIVSRQQACFWRRWKVFCCSSRSISGTVAGEGGDLSK